MILVRMHIFDFLKKLLKTRCICNSNHLYCFCQSI